LSAVHVLVHRRAGKRRSAGRSAGIVQQRPGAAQPCRVAVGGHRSQDRRAVGQLPADLLAGRADSFGDALVPQLGGRPMARIVIVSNRVPIPKARGASAGGLAVALRDLLTPGTLWFGWSGRLTSEPTLQPAIVEARGVTYATIDLTSDAYRGYYVGFANGALWPLLHFRLGL